MLYDDLMKLLLEFDKNRYDNWNCYNEYTPEIVMEKFKELYL